MKIGSGKWNGKFLAYRPPMYCPSVDSAYDPLKYHIYTQRELIKFAKAYTSQDKQQTAIKRDVKKQSKHERAFVIDNLRTKGEDADPNYPKTKFADTWNWD